MNYSRKKIKERLQNTGSQEVRERKRVSVFLIALLVGLFLGAVVVGVSVCLGVFVQILRDTPEITSINEVKPSAAKSIIYASDGSIMQELVESGSNRITVSIDEVPEDLINAIVDIEDARFFDHDGVDVKGVIRAVVVGLTSGSLSEGASTITQQLIKNNVFDGGFETNVGDRITRKFQEQLLALKLEKQLDKKTILQHYLNTINLGANSLGVEVAAQRYFGKHVSDLDLAECTTIVATTSSPTRYNPITHPDKNQVRRLIILGKMLEEGHITQEQYNEASSDEVYKRVSANNETYTGIHTFSYFTDAVYEDVMDALTEELGYSDTQATNLLYSGGLRIYTTMDPKVQAVLEDEINQPENYIINGVNYLEYALTYKLGVRLLSGNEYYYDESNVQKYFRTLTNNENYFTVYATKEELQAAVAQFRAYVLSETGGEVIAENITATIEPQASVVVMDQKTGYVKGIVGGRGNKAEMGSLILNRATQSTRQPGSTFKVISTYAPAIDIKGATLATTYYDAELTYNGKSIKNWWGNAFVGYANIREGITASMNIVAVKCLENTVSESLAYDYVKAFGITSVIAQDKSPVFTLGGLTYGASNYEMTAAYAAIANDGVYIEPVFWTKITDTQGNLILENAQVTRRVILSDTAKLLTNAMEDSVTPQFTPFPNEYIQATNIPCQVEGVPVAGKSGTTNDANDLWFIGFSSNYTMGIWSGYDSNKAFGESPGYQKVIWQKIMTRISEGKESKPFDYSGLVQAKICSKSGLLAVEGVCDKCGDKDCHIYYEYFTRNTVPTKECDRHAEFSICKVSGHLANEYCPEECIEKKIYLTLDKKDATITSLTSDSLYTMPEELLNSICDEHDEYSAVEESSEEESEEEDG